MDNPERGKGKAQAQATDVDVIIGSKDGSQYLTRCLEYVYRQRFDGRIRTTIVDNDSTDSSVFVVSSQYPQVQLIHNKQDLGQAGAYNLALSKTDGRFVLFLSQDVELEKDFVARQVSFLNQGQDYSGAGAVILRGDDGSGRRILDSLGVDLKGARPFLTGHNKPMSEIPVQGLPIFGPAGAAAFWRRQALDLIAPDGLVFDEDLSFRHIDLDLAWRASWLGMHFATNVLARAHHHRGFLSAKKPGRLQEADFRRRRNRFLVYRKNLLFDGWKRFGKEVRSAGRKELVAHARHYGLISGMDLWFDIRRAVKRMKTKAAGLEKRAKRRPEDMFRDIFSVRSQAEK